MEQIKELDVVALLVDLPEQGLRRGDVGTAVQVFEANEHHSAGYLMEFLNEDKDVWTLVDITDPSQVMRLNFKRKAA
jgi:hypothetical protein